MIRILHAADLHLDSPFFSLGREKAILRRQELRLLPGRIADAAREHRADILLLAGDIFDSDDPFSDSCHVLEEALSSLDIPVFIAPGNHDHYSSRSPWRELTFDRNVHLFTEESIRCVELPSLGARVWGTAFTGRSRGAPLEGFEAEKDGNTIDIMVLHGEGGVPVSEYGPVTEEQIARSGMDYIAFGHIHSFSGLRRAGDTFYAWPGCPEGRGFDETGEKGVILAEVSVSGTAVSLLPVCERRYEILPVDITGAQDIAARIASQLPRSTDSDIFRIVLTGEAEAPPDTAALRQRFAGRFFELELRDETRPSMDIWSECGTGSLKGLFLSRLRGLYDAASGANEREKILRAARWGLLAMENGDEPPL